MVQSDIQFGAVFVTNQAHVLRPLGPVRPTERSEIRRKIMQAQVRSGGSVVDGLNKAIDLLKDFHSSAENPRQLALVLLVSRAPTDLVNMSATIEKIKQNIPATEVYFVTTVATPSVDKQWETYADSIPSATFRAAQTHRELPTALMECYRQLGAFDQAYAEELVAIKAVIEKCCREKTALCKLVDNLNPPTDCKLTDEKIEKLIACINVISNRLDHFEINITDSVSRKLMEQVESLKVEILKLQDGTDNLKIAIASIESHLVKICED